jgi:hypothetical protein
MRRTLVHNRKLIAWVAISTVMLIISIGVGAVTIRDAAEQQRDTNRIVCRAVNRIDSTLVATLMRSEANLPKLAYFQQHPDELAAQLAEVRRQIALFQPRLCR